MTMKMRRETATKSNSRRMSSTRTRSIFPSIFGRVLVDEAHGVKSSMMLSNQAITPWTPYNDLTSLNTHIALMRHPNLPPHEPPTTRLNKHFPFRLTSLEPHDDLRAQHAGSCRKERRNYQSDQQAATVGQDYSTTHTKRA